MMTLLFLPRAVSARAFLWFAGGACLPAVLLAACLLVPAIAHAQATSDDPIIGVWRTFDDKTGHPEGSIRISKAADRYVGTIERGEEGDDPNARCTACRGGRHNMPLLGMVILEGLERRDANTYSNGRIIDPDTGMSWKCDVHVSPDGRSLVIHGFIGLRVFGRSQTWKRDER